MSEKKPKINEMRKKLLNYKKCEQWKNEQKTQNKCMSEKKQKMKEM